MWWFIGFGGFFLYMLLFFTLGLSTLTKWTWLDVLLRVLLPGVLALRGVHDAHEPGVRPSALSFDNQANWRKNARRVTNVVGRVS